MVLTSVLLACAARVTEAPSTPSAQSSSPGAALAVPRNAAFATVADSGGAPAASPVASLSLNIPDQVSGSGLDRPVDITLTNEGSTPLWANVRMALGAGPDTPHEVSLDVEAPAGPLPYGCFAKIGVASEGDYRALAPGESLTRHGTLFCYARDMDQPGAYSASARYRDRRRDPPAPSAGAAYLSGEVVSPVVRFRVLPATGGNKK